MGIFKTGSRGSYNLRNPRSSKNYKPEGSTKGFAWLTKIKQIPQSLRLSIKRRMSSDSHKLKGVTAKTDKEIHARKIEITSSTLDAAPSSLRSDKVTHIWNEILGEGVSNEYIVNILEETPEFLLWEGEVGVQNWMLLVESIVSKASNEKPKDNAMVYIDDESIDLILNILARKNLQNEATGDSSLQCFARYEPDLLVSIISSLDAIQLSELDLDHMNKTGGKLQDILESHSSSTFTEYNKLYDQWIENAKSLEQMRSKSKEKVRLVDVEKFLGSGAEGKVLNVNVSEMGLASKLTDDSSGMQLADSRIKLAYKMAVSGDEGKKSLEKEREILNGLNHPNIIKVQEVVIGGKKDSLDKDVVIEERVVASEDGAEDFVMVDFVGELESPGLTMKIYKGSINDYWNELTEEEKYFSVENILKGVAYLHSE